MQAPYKQRSLSVIGTILIGSIFSLVFAWLFLKQRRGSQIGGPPGTKSMRLARFCYSAKTIERVFDPIYADFCEEYFAALAAGERWKARWIRFRYYKDFAKAIGLFGVVRLAKTVFEYWEKIA